MLERYPVDHGHSGALGAILSSFSGLGDRHS
jgi:hypothetical protein